MDGSVIPVVFCFDVEPDNQGPETPAPGPWRGVAALHTWVEDLRARAEALTGRPARFAWYLRMDRQVEQVYGTPAHAVEAHREVLDDVVARGDDVGLHIHAWRRLGADRWVDDYGDPGWFRENVDASFAAFAEAFGHPCRLTRIGSRFLDATAVQALVANGATLDSTAEPARSPVPDGDQDDLRGDLPDFRRTPRRPHRLEGGLVELPLTASRRRLGWHPKAHLSRLRRHGPTERLDRPLRFGSPVRPGEHFGELLARSLPAQRRPYLAFAVRSNGPIDERQGPRLDRHLHALLSLPQAPGFAFLTPPAALEALGAP